MPYERNRTIIQMAPRSLTRAIVHPRGMGAAQCPSDEQLQGIVDPFDPCQAANIIGQPVPSQTPNVTYNPSTGAPILSFGTSPTVPGSSMSNFFSQNSGLILAGGALLFGIAIIKAMR